MIKILRGARQPERRLEDDHLLKGNSANFTHQSPCTNLTEYCMHESSIRAFGVPQGAVQILINWCHLRQLFGGGSEGCKFENLKKYESGGRKKRIYQTSVGCSSSLFETSGSKLRSSVWTEHTWFFQKKNLSAVCVTGRRGAKKKGWQEQKKMCHLWLCCIDFNSFF